MGLRKLKGGGKVVELYWSVGGSVVRVIAAAFGPPVGFSDFCTRQLIRLLAWIVCQQRSFLRWGVQTLSRKASDCSPCDLQLQVNMERVSEDEVERVFWLRQNIYTGHVKASMVQSHAGASSLTAQVQQFGGVDALHNGMKGSGGAAFLQMWPGYHCWSSVQNTMTEQSNNLSPAAW
eukprot:jgi/Chlat1/1876/Chrsp143S02199